MSLNDAEMHLQNRDLPLAKMAFNASEQAGEDADRCSAGRWTVAMLSGDFEAAWRESDALRARGAPDPHRFWDGQSLQHKRVIVRCLHGLGDAVQMFRYATALRALASRVTWEVPPRLVDLAYCFDGVGEVVTWGDGGPAVAPVWDSQLEVMELPYVFRTRRHLLPLAQCYCRVPVEELRRVHLCMGDRTPRVGVVWAAGEWNPERSVPFALLRPLLNKREITFWNLQDRALPQTNDSLRCAKAVCGDGLLALAATVANLDLVVTVDTLAAHLAGAIGKPVWVMLPNKSDWRWLAEGERSPWYPTMRLFRQERAGDWAGVVERICIAFDKEFV